jgi:sigma-B regulation protein RsbQ
MMFAHGFGCDQNMWRLVAPASPTASGWSCSITSAPADPTLGPGILSLDGYAADVLDICRELELTDVVLVGHSVSATIGLLAAIAEPQRFAKLVLVGPSVRYIDDDGYVGGFTAQDIAELLESLDSNYLGWSSAMAPAIMANPDRPELGEELTASFCRTDPNIARHFAKVTFLSDNRADLAKVTTPTLVLQCSNDLIAPVAVGEYIRDALPDSSYALLQATGHCPHLSAPDETTDAIAAFVGR